jgi:hypothetical protein
MNRKIAAILVAATMLTTPAFAASVASSADTPATQTLTRKEVTTTPDKSIKKHRAYAQNSYGHKFHHTKHVNHQAQRPNKISKESPTPASTKDSTKAVATAPVKTPVKN